MKFVFHISILIKLVSEIALDKVKKSERKTKLSWGIKKGHLSADSADT